MKHPSIVERAIAHGAHTAIRDASHGSSCTYSQLVDRSRDMAFHLLNGSSDLNEKRIAFLVPASSDYVVTQWAVWRAGGIAVPLSLSATEPELEYVLSDAAVDTVVVSAELAAKMEILTPLCRRRGMRLLQTQDTPPAVGCTLPDIDPNRRAMILYTSGTTSKPKGVVTTHANIRSQIESLVDAWEWEVDDVIPLFLPLHHIHGIINILSCALWVGAEVDVFPKFDMEAILHRVADRAYTLFMAVPTIYVKLIDALESDSLPTDRRTAIVRGFASMRLMVSGSAALTASVHRQWTDLTGQKLLERYGMTEIGMALSNPYHGERRPGAVGTALPGVEIRLQSDVGETIVDEGQPGEIIVRGPNVFAEYWNKPDVTRDSFVDGNWFRTGDEAVVEDGYCRIMGRSSVDIIKSGGHKLSALEIEASLLDHPAISQCAVVGLPDPTWGEIVAVAVVLAPEKSLDLGALQAWARDRVSSYKLPRRLLMVDSLPRNAMGKVTKPAVSKLFKADSAKPE